ncbi:MAG: ATP-binding protein [Anaerolineae bacterium]|jgi:hypothetical protein|nr:ATP-binding protein [Anaerolineae bacterium]
MGVIGYSVQRESFSTDPQMVVTTGQNYTQVDYQLEISPEERLLINQWKNELHQRGALNHHPGVIVESANLIWTYPAQPGYEEVGNAGGYRYLNTYDWAVLKGKDYGRRLDKLNASPLKDRYQAGGVYFFEQERRLILNAFGSSSTPTDEKDSLNLDIRKILIDLGLKDAVRQSNSESWYEIIRSGYNYVCAPRRMGKVYTTDSFADYQIEFFDADHQLYTIDGLSSGEHSVLYFLTRYVFRRMRNSIVLIDELELHLHPTWQRRLLQYLTKIRSGNQFIITTHSPTIMQSVFSDELIRLGDLDEVPAWQSAPLD